MKKVVIILIVAILSGCGSVPGSLRTHAKTCHQCHVIIDHSYYSKQLSVPQFSVVTGMHNRAVHETLCRNCYRLLNVNEKRLYRKMVS